MKIGREGVARGPGVWRRQNGLWEGLGNEWGDIWRLLGISGARVLGRTEAGSAEQSRPYLSGSCLLGPKLPSGRCSPSGPGPGTGSLLLLPPPPSMPVGGAAVRAPVLKRRRQRRRQVPAHASTPSRPVTGRGRGRAWPMGASLGGGGQELPAAGLSELGLLSLNDPRTAVVGPSTQGMSDSC